MGYTLVALVPGLANLALWLGVRATSVRRRVLVGSLFVTGASAPFWTAIWPSLSGNEDDLPRLLMIWASFLLAGVGGFAARYTQPGVRPTSWAHPLVFVTVAPLFTMVVTGTLVEVLAECGDWVSTPSGLFSYRECDAGDVRSAHLVGVVNLLALLWVAVPGWTRATALIAGALGGVRFLLPQVVLASSGTIETDAFGTREAMLTAGGFLLWLVGLLLLVVLALSTAGWRVISDD